MFSLKKLNDNSVVIGQIDGGKYDSKIIYFNENSGGDNDIDYNMKINGLINDIMDTNDYYDELKGIKKKKAKLLLREHLMKNIPPLNDKERDRFNKVKNDITNKGDKEIQLVDGQIKPYSSTNHEMYYICGMAGSGKSYFMNEYAKSYKLQNPKNDIFLFSKLDDDKTLNKNKSIQRIQIDEELLENPIDAKELSNSLTMFDDTMMIRDDKISKEINEKLMKDVLEVGRQYNTQICVTNHLINDYKKTRPMMNECTHLVIFLRGSNKYALNYCLSKYLGLDKYQIKKLFNLRNTRWAVINKKTFPMTVIHQNGCYILDNENSNENDNKQKYKDFSGEKTEKNKVTHNEPFMKNRRKLKEISSESESDYEIDSGSDYSE